MARDLVGGAPLFRSGGRIFEPLNGFAIGLLVLAACWALRVSFFIGAFAAGLTVVTLSQPVRDSFARFGEFVTELLKFAALLVFGLHLAPAIFSPLSWRGVAIIVAGLVAVRMAVLPVCFAGSSLPWRDRWTAGYFGPKGFASVVYELMVLQLGTATGDPAAHLIGVTIAISMVLYSSTDILAARRYVRAGRP